MEQEELIIDDLKIEVDCDEPVTETTEQDSKTDDCSDSAVTEECDAHSETEAEELMESEEEKEGAASTGRKRSYKQYFCCVLGCRNTRPPDVPPEQRLTMFSLPTEPTRKRKWLRMIDREDLADTNSKHYVCEVHFYPGSIIPTTSRKLLKKSAIPVVQLPEGGRGVPVADAGSQVWVYVAHKASQAAPPAASRAVQTTAALLDHLPAVRKLQLQIKELTAQRRRCDSKKHELATLHQLCDKYMGEQFATLAKIHLQNKKHSTGNRYDNDFKKFCLRLYDTSSKAYDILSELLPLPGKSNLKSFRTREDDGSSQTLVQVTSAGETSCPMPPELGGSPIQEAPVDCAPIQGDPLEGEPIQGAPLKEVLMEGNSLEAVPMEGAPVEALVDQQTQTAQSYSHLLAQYSEHKRY